MEIYSYCRAVRFGTVYMYTCRTHTKATATATAATEREEEGSVALLSF